MVQRREITGEMQKYFKFSEKRNRACQDLPDVVEVVTSGTLTAVNNSITKAERYQSVTNLYLEKLEEQAKSKGSREAFTYKHYKRRTNVAPAL